MTTIQIKGTKYYTHDVLSCGDYSHNAMVGVSNVDVILENHAEKVLDVWSDLSTQEEEDFDPANVEVILVRGNWSSRCVYIREDLFPDYEKKLDRYPLLDEEDHSAREYEQAQEDWENYGARDFLCELKKKALEIHNDEDLEVYLDNAYDPDQDALWNLHNEYTQYGSTFEGCSTHFYIEETIKEIAETDFFRDLLLTAKEHAQARQKQASDLEAVLFE